MTTSGDRKRAFKRLGIAVSELGFGAWGIGGRLVGSWTPVAGKEALLAYLEAGGNFIDTAATYGESEAIIGETLRDFSTSQPVYLATKSKAGETADTLPRLRTDLEQSLRRLRREWVDVFYLHMPPEDDDVIDQALGMCEQFRAEGKIRGIGASIKGPAVTDATLALARKYVDSGRIDVLQLVYSILRQKNLAAIEYAGTRDVAVVARTSLESGFLTGKFAAGIRFPDTDHRSRWNAVVDAIVVKVGELKQTPLPPGYQTLQQLAVKFALAPPGVTSVIVGAKNAVQQNENTRTGLLPDLDAGTTKFLTAAFGDFTGQCNPRE